MEVDVSRFGEGSPWLGGQNSISARGVLLDSTTETVSLSLLLCPMPVCMGMHSSVKMTMQEPIVHVLFKITCSFTESRLSHGQQSPQTCIQLNICGTSLGDRDSLTSHRTSTSLLMYFGRNGTMSPKQPFGGSFRTWGIVVSHSWWQMANGLTCYWDLCEIDTYDLYQTWSLVQCDPLKTLLFKYHFNAITWTYKSESKQNVLYYIHMKYPLLFLIHILISCNNHCYVINKKTCCMELEIPAAMPSWTFLWWKKWWMKELSMKGKNK